MLMLFSMGVRAQYDVSFSHYWTMEPSFNPASVGKDTKLTVVGAYAMDLAGFEHNPQTAYIGADMPLYFMRSYHGAGLSLINDNIGLFTHQRLSGQYAYRFKMFGGNMALGVQAGMIMEKFDGSNVELNEDNDPAFTTSELSGNHLDLGAGFYYSTKKWYVGASVQHLNSPLVELGEKNELKIDPTYYLTGGYNIKLRNPFLSIPATALVRYTGDNMYRADVGARLVYTNDKKILYGGVSYSPQTSVTVLVGGSVQGINIGYSYEMYTSGINPGNGSHELYVRYQTDINLQKKGRNRHKSVRYL